VQIFSKKYPELHIDKRGWCRKLPTSRDDFENLEITKYIGKYNFYIWQKQIFNQ